MMHAFGCKQERWQVCLACGAQVCACHGMARGQCPVCFRGFLSNYYKAQPCGYKGCTSHAVAAVPRVKRACLEHAVKRGGYKPPAIPPEPARGTPTEYTQHICRQLGIVL